jgi:hypothetical protein
VCFFGGKSAEATTILTPGVVGPSLLLTFCWAGTPAFEKEEKRGQIYFHDLFTLLEYKSVPFFPFSFSRI